MTSRGWFRFRLGCAAASPLITIWGQGGHWRSVPQARRPVRVGCDRVGAVSLLHFAAARHSPAPRLAALASSAPRSLLLPIPLDSCHLSALGHVAFAQRSGTETVGPTRPRVRWYCCFCCGNRPVCYGGPVAAGPWPLPAVQPSLSAQLRGWVNVKAKSPLAALDGGADRPRHERGYAMPRGGWGASAAHQQAHPGGQWTPVASSSLTVARATHAGAEIDNSSSSWAAGTTPNSREHSRKWGA